MTAPFRVPPILLSVLCLTVPGFAQSSEPIPAAIAPPPVAKAEPVSDTYFGTTVVDNYRYMENLKAPYVASWFKGQADYTRAVLDRIHGRKRLLDRMAALDAGTTAHVDLPEIANGWYFYTKRGVNDSVPKLYVRRGLHGGERLLVDPNSGRSATATHNAIDYFTPSQDGGLVAYAASPGGSEAGVLHVMDRRTGKDTGLAIDRAEYNSIGWLPDGKSFFYNRLAELLPGAPASDKYQNNCTYLHRLGSDPEKDRPILGPGLSRRVSVVGADIPICFTQPGSRYVLGAVSHGVLNEITLYIASIDAVVKAASSNAIPWVKVCDVADNIVDMRLHGESLYLLSDKASSRFNVLRTSAAHPNLATASVVVPASNAVITGIQAGEDSLYVTLNDGGIGRLSRIAYGTGNIQNVPLPLDGSVSISADTLTPGVIIGLQSWTKAYSIYAYDPASRKIADTGLQPHGPYDAPGDLVSEEVKVKAADGALIPLSLVFKRGLRRNGLNPVWLVGYGAYGISQFPYFDPTKIAWFERGGIFASAHVRGGGEYGEDWHRQGMIGTKPNTWNDFIACAQYLIDRKYTTSAKLDGIGGSAGGIPIGRAITTRPDLFGAACSVVGSLNTLRAEFGANGVPNIPEFGSVTTAEGFAALKEMDSLSHVRDGVRYPAVLIVTGINDPRVDPWESGKMAARLQAATASGKPVLLRLDYDAGHGIGSTNRHRLESGADIMSFFLWQDGVPDFQPLP